MDNRTKKTNNKRFVRYPEGAEMYSMSLSKFQQLAKDAKACYKMNRLVLVNLDILDEYLETFHIEDEEYYVQMEVIYWQRWDDQRLKILLIRGLQSD